MKFDHFTVVLLVLRPDAPRLDEAAAAALQDAHLAHLAELHQAGHLLAAGPLSDEGFRGLSLFTVAPEEARRLAERDPAVRAGRLEPKVIPWMVPAGALSYSPTRFPRSIAEAEAD
ncbi:MAG TPA: YciI family protein [Streptosporangiaceae bacterium]|nr:YciI family protein [Streptosporangiaceae bacterium]